VCHEVCHERNSSESCRGCSHLDTSYYLVVGCSSWCWTDPWDTHTLFPSASHIQHAIHRDLSCRSAHGADTSSCGRQIYRRMRVASRRLARWSRPLQLPADVSTELKRSHEISHAAPNDLPSPWCARWVRQYRQLSIHWSPQGTLYNDTPYSVPNLHCNLEKLKAPRWDAIPWAY
jgi:hypothetical protein